MKGTTTYGQLTYFDTKEQEIQITTPEGNIIEFDIDSDIELPEDSDFDNLIGKDIGVMEVDDIALKIIWQGNRPY